MNELTIKIKYLTEDLIPLEQLKIGDAIDVRAAENICLNKGEYKQIPLGFSCKLPDGYCAILMPRSSTFKKFGIIQANSLGLVDESYCGNNDEWQMPVYCLVDNVNIPKNERIGQFMIVPKMPNIVFEQVDDLGYEDRGGFGSTGRI